MRYIDFIDIPPLKNQRIYIKNVLGIEAKRGTRALYLKARLSRGEFRFYCIYTVMGIYSGYTCTPRCIVKALDFDTAVEIAKALGFVDKDASIDHDLSKGRETIHNLLELPVIQLNIGVSK